MLTHRLHQCAPRSFIHTLALTVVVLSLAGLAALYARTVAVFLRVFVQVFLEELRATSSGDAATAARTTRAEGTDPAA
jgi:hypothetical protein